MYLSIDCPVLDFSYAYIICISHMRCVKLTSKMKLFVEIVNGCVKEYSF